MTIDDTMKMKGMLQQAQIPYALPAASSSWCGGYTNDQSLPVSPCLSTSPPGQTNYLYDEVVPTYIKDHSENPKSPPVKLPEKLSDLSFLEVDIDRPTAWQSPSAYSDSSDVRAEEVMMSDSRCLPTLAELNNSDNLSVLDDINSVIFHDLQATVDTSTMYEAPWTSPVHTFSNTSAAPSEASLYSPKILSDTETPSLNGMNMSMQHTESKSSNGKQEAGVKARGGNTPMLQKLLASPVRISMPSIAESGSCQSHMEKVQCPEVGSTNNVIPDNNIKDTSETSSRNFTDSTELKWQAIKEYMDTSTGQPPTLEAVEIKQELIAEDTLSSVDDGDRDDDLYDFMNDSSDGENDFTDDDNASTSSFVDEMLSDIKKEKHFFWQYNTQSKGPKGKRLVRGLESSDPHVLGNFEDPVFDPDAQDVKYKHGGRVRRGDGNDITPNPYKLFQIGNQLRKLNKRIYEITHPTKATSTAKGKSRREKNKYASRACRLKKKAQHEANKVKLYGLDKEHGELMTVLDNIKAVVQEQLVHGKATDGETLCCKLDWLMQKHLTEMIASNTADYVNSVLEKIALGDRTGGVSVGKTR